MTNIKLAQKPAMPKPDMPQPDAAKPDNAGALKPKQPTPNSKEPTGVRDLLGEVWPINSPTGRMLIDTATGEGAKPDYIYGTPAETKPAVPTNQQPTAPQAPEVKTITPNDLKSVPMQPKSTGTGNSAFYQQGLTPIKEMQKSLIALSKDIASHDIQSTPDRSLGANDTLTGANPFMNFLVNSYMNGAKMSGKQFLDTDVKQPTRMNTAKQNDNFKGVLKTIQRIGTPNTEQAPDGNWGPRTNNSLKQIYALAYALMEVQKDMGMTVPGYTESDLSELHANIPENIEKVNINEKVQKAGVISKNLNKFRAVYDNFREKVLDNAEDKAKISQAKPLYTKQAPVKSAVGLTEYEQKLYEKYKSTELDIDLNGHKISIMPYNLSNMTAFKKYLVSHAQQIGLTPAEVDAIKKGDEKRVNDMLIDVANSLTGVQ